VHSSNWRPGAGQAASDPNGSRGARFRPTRHFPGEHWSSEPFGGARNLRVSARWPVHAVAGCILAR
jgi:hypothetical protein